MADSVAHQFEGPIKKVDGYLCSGLDYVEAKIPADKLPPEEIYTTTKEYVNNTVTPAVQSACAKVQPAVKTAREVIEPAMQVAKHAVEPALQNVRQMAEPLVHPAVEKATALKDYGTQKITLQNHRLNAQIVLKTPKRKKRQKKIPSRYN